MRNIMHWCRSNITKIYLNVCMRKADWLIDDDDDGGGGDGDDEYSDE